MDSTNPEPSAADPAAEPRHDPLAALWSPATVRARCAAIRHAVDDGRSPWFTLDRERLPELAEQVTESLRAGIPQPVTAVGDADSAAELHERLAGHDPRARARACIDLTVVCALLDTEAASAWAFDERGRRPTATLALPAHRQRRDDLLAMLDRASGTAAPSADAAPDPATATPPTAPAAADAGPPPRAVGSAALAAAMRRAFLDGAFSSDPADALRVDARALMQLDSAALRALLPGASGPALLAFDARAEMLRRLGGLLGAATGREGPPARPAGELERWLAHGGEVDAVELLQPLVSRWSAAWFDGGRALGLPVGDVWPHRWAGAATSPGAASPGGRATAGWVPLHLPGQRLVHALAEPMRQAGLPVRGLDALTARADIALCRLLLDAGVVRLRDPRDLSRLWKPADERTVELRALAVALVDELVQPVRDRLGRDMPLPSRDAVQRACSHVAARAATTVSAPRFEGHGTLL